MQIIAFGTYLHFSQHPNFFPVAILFYSTLSSDMGLIAQVTFISFKICQVVHCDSPKVRLSMRSSTAMLRGCTVGEGPTVHTAAIKNIMALETWSYDHLQSIRMKRWELAGLCSGLLSS